jgi:hypothetical protein
MSCQLATEELCRPALLQIEDCSDNWCHNQPDSRRRHAINLGAAETWYVRQAPVNVPKHLITKERSVGNTDQAGMVERG